MVSQELNRGERPTGSTCADADQHVAVAQGTLLIRVQLVCQTPFLLHASQPLTTVLQHKLTLSWRRGLVFAFELHEVPVGPFLQPVLNNLILPLLLPSLTLLANLH